MRVRVTLERTVVQHKSMVVEAPSVQAAEERVRRALDYQGDETARLLVDLGTWSEGEVEGEIEIDAAPADKEV